MRWIVLSQNNPASLHACLESGREFLPGTKPDVIVQEDEPHALVASRFTEIHFFSGEISLILAACVMREKANGAPEQMTLVTTDDMLWVSKPRVADAWTALRDRGDIAGISLGLPPEGALLQAGDKWFTWDAKLSPAFTFGTIYRTNDLIGSLYRAEYDSPQALFDALCGDPGMQRKPRMGCLPERSLERFPVHDPSATQRYLGGEIIDLRELRQERVRYRFKLHQEE